MVVVFENELQDFITWLDKISPNINYKEIEEDINYLIKILKSKLNNNSAFVEVSEYFFNNFEKARVFLKNNFKLLGVEKENNELMYNMSNEIRQKIVENFNSVYSVLLDIDNKLGPISLNEIYLKRIDALLNLKKSLFNLRRKVKVSGRIGDVISILDNDKFILYVSLDVVKGTISEIEDFSNSSFLNENNNKIVEILSKFISEIKDRKYDLNNTNGNINSFYYEMYRFYKLRSSIFDESERMENLINKMKDNFVAETESTINNHKEKTENFYKNVSKTISLFNDKLEVILNETNRAESRLQEVDSKVLNLRSEINRDIESIKNDANELIDSIVEDVKKNTNQSFEVLQDNILNLDKEIDGYKELISDKTTEQLTSVYKTEAKWEKRSYYIFSIMGLLVIAAAIIYSGISLAEFHEKYLANEQVDYNYLIIRLIFSLIIFSAVAYTSRIASRSYTFWKKMKVYI